MADSYQFPFPQKMIFIYNNIKSETTDFSKLCRCCMEDGDIGIYETDFQGLSLAAIIEFCTHTELALDEDLPKNICQQCFDQLTASYLFIAKYLKLQEYITKIADSQIREEIKIEVEQSDTKSSLCNNNIDNEINYVSDNSENDVDIKVPFEAEITDISGSSDEEERVIKLQESVILKEEYSDDEMSQNQIKCLELLDENVAGSNTKVFNKISFTKQPITAQKKQKNSCKSESNKTETVYFCLKCNESFTYMKHLKNHCKDTGHPTPRRYPCHLCSMKFMTKSHLISHVRTHSKEKPYTCDECGMKFTLCSNLQRHKRRHTGEKKFFCEICGKGFTQKYTLMIHTRLHNGETPYKCPQCGKGFPARPLLNKHLKKHNGQATCQYSKYGSVKVECNICKKMITRNGMYIHKKVQHGLGLEKFLCNLCGKTYTTKTSLESHMNVHTKVRTYDCDVCSKSFYHNNYLKIHMRIHSGEKPHRCDVCGRTFTQRGHLDGHRRTHTGARPYTCSQCNKSFALRGNLKVHMRIHTGETPHRCSICNKGFFDTSSKKKHESTVHKIY